MPWVCLGCTANLKIMTGYSFKTNLYGLAVDTVMEYELVLPTGEVKIVTERDEDLWFALKVRQATPPKKAAYMLTLISTQGRIQQLREFNEVVH